MLRHRRRLYQSDGQIYSITVGKGGIPDASGKVTLDACIMDEKGRAGAVTYLEHIVHPISVARLVMEKTPHVMLSGKGALEFALDNGFKKENLLTPKMKKEWKKWKKEKREFSNKINIENQRKLYSLYKDRLFELQKEGLIIDTDLTVMCFSIFGIVAQSIRWFNEKGPLSKEEVAQNVIQILFTGILRLKNR